jgi:hypothetical protein
MANLVLSLLVWLSPQASSFTDPPRALAPNPHYTTEHCRTLERLQRNPQRILLSTLTILVYSESTTAGSAGRQSPMIRYLLDHALATWAPFFLYLADTPGQLDGPQASRAMDRAVSAAIRRGGPVPLSAEENERVQYLFHWCGLASPSTRPATPRENQAMSQRRAAAPVQLIGPAAA